MLHNNEAACEIAAVQNEGMEYVTTAFMAHLAYGHCGDAAMQLIAQAPELYGDVLANDHVNVIIQSPQACKPLDRMCVHTGDGQTYLVMVDSMSSLSCQDTMLHVSI